MNTLKSAVAVVTAVTVGAAIGAAVALLLAPTRGAARRDRLLRPAARAGRPVADDGAVLLAQSQDMVAEGGPASA